MRHRKSPLRPWYRRRDENLDRTLSRDQRRREQHPADGSAETRSRSIEVRQRSHLHSKRKRRFRLRRRNPLLTRGKNQRTNRPTAWLLSTCPGSQARSTVRCDRCESIPGGCVRSRQAAFLFSRRISPGPGHCGAQPCEVIDRTLQAYGCGFLSPRSGRDCPLEARRERGEAPGGCRHRAEFPHRRENRSNGRGCLSGSKNVRRSVTGANGTSVHPQGKTRLALVCRATRVHDREMPASDTPGVPNVRHPCI